MVWVGKYPKGTFSIVSGCSESVHPGLEWIQISRYVFEILLALPMFAQLNAKSYK